MIGGAGLGQYGEVYVLAGWQCRKQVPQSGHFFVYFDLSGHLFQAATCGANETAQGIVGDDNAAGQKDGTQLSDDHIEEFDADGS